ncbi:MAG: hypothetical protein ABXS91_06130 [Sulfurimonas sp.]
MPSKFRIEGFEPKEIERAQKAVERELNEILDSQTMPEIKKQVSSKKSFWKRLLAWFK